MNYTELIAKENALKETQFPRNTVIECSQMALYWNDSYSFCDNIFGKTFMSCRMSAMALHHFI